MRSTIFFVIVHVLFFSCKSFSMEPEKNLNINKSNLSDDERHFSILLDTRSIINYGFGFAMGYRLNNLWNVELFYSKYDLRSNDPLSINAFSSSDDSHKYTSIGFRGTYRFWSLNKFTGIFLGAGLTEINSESIYNDRQYSIFGPVQNLDAKREVQNKKLGPSGLLGFEYAATTNDQFPISLKGLLSYGPGHFHKGPTSDEDYKNHVIQNGFLLDFLLGFTF
ncbi:MAG: outer membrane beta-barrel protein [Pseudobdellovibrionaceae bacterium]|jgi:hypothetical protein